MFSDIMHGKRKSEEDVKQVKECLKAAREALPDSLFEGYIISMKKRTDMCIKAEGWHIKY